MMKCDENLNFAVSVEHIK